MACVGVVGVLSVLYLACLTYADDSLTVNVGSDCSYRLLIDGVQWLKNASRMVQADGRHHSTLDGTLIMTQPVVKDLGTDKIGDWAAVRCRYGTSPHTPIVDFTIKSYQDANMVIFSQKFLVSLTNTSVGNKDGLMSVFPSFVVDGDGSLGLLHYSGVFFWRNNIIQKWKADMHKLGDGLNGGPLVLFDQNNRVVVISAFNKFMAASMNHRTDTHSVEWGIMGDVNAVPDGYELQTILYYGNEGINKAMENWGSTLLKFYDKNPYLRYQDPSVKYLGFYTDNGAYYYHHTEPNMNYGQTLLNVLEYAKQQDIPYRYWQLDDWWYYIAGHGYGATVNWTAMPEIFPNGLRSFYNKTALPIVAHNRYWSAKTTYAKQNGGLFDFIIDKENSLPLKQEFWDYLFTQAVQWGLTVYEQDWLNYQTLTFSPLHSDIHLGRKWLMQMGEAASRCGIRIQYCMALPRHVLQSVEIPTVTQIRSSDDYLDSPHGHLQWKIGISSMFSAYLGLAPWKDNMWSTKIQDGNPYNKSEPYPLLQAVVSLLSTGPVGPSDRIGHSNASLIKSLARADGLLLKPTKAITAINSQILQTAFGGSIGPVGEVYTTYSDIGNYRFGIILAADISQGYRLTPTEAGFGSNFGDSVIYSYNSQPQKHPKLPSFNDKSPLEITTRCTAENFCLYYTAPVSLWRGTLVTVLGELDKIVPVSPERVSLIEASNLDLQVTLSGSSGEEIKFYFYHGSDWLMIHCVMSDIGQAVISLAKKSCLEI